MGQIMTFGTYVGRSAGLLAKTGFLQKRCLVIGQFCLFDGQG
jgi:hypothetical protein